MPIGSDIEATTLPNRGKLSAGQRERASKAISKYMKEPGMERSQVIAKSLSMARRRQLDKDGSYTKSS